MARDSKVIIRLTDDIKDQFQTLADEYGMTVSALGSYVIGKFIQTENRNKQFQESMIEPTVQKLTEMTGESIDGKQLEHFMQLMVKSMGSK